MTKISLDELIELIPQDPKETSVRGNAWELRVLHDRCGPEITIVHQASHDKNASEELRVTFQNGKQRVRLWIKRDGESITNSDFSLAVEIAAFIKSKTDYPIKFRGLGMVGYEGIYVARQEIQLRNQRILKSYAKR